MRLWHYKLLPYLPKAQLVSQLRECISIAKDISEKGCTNHILINRVMDYPIDDFRAYCNLVINAINHRGYDVSKSSVEKLVNYIGMELDEYRRYSSVGLIFPFWHDSDYMRVCMTNLYEKHHYAKGKSAISDEDWAVLLDGYYSIRKENFVV